MDVVALYNGSEISSYTAQFIVLAQGEQAPPVPNVSICPGNSTGSFIAHNDCNGFLYIGLHYILKNLSFCSMTQNEQKNS